MQNSNHASEKATHPPIHEPTNTIGISREYSVDALDKSKDEARLWLKSKGLKEPRQNLWLLHLIDGLILRNESVDLESLITPDRADFPLNGMTIFEHSIAMGDSSLAMHILNTAPNPDRLKTTKRWKILQDICLGGMCDVLKKVLDEGISIIHPSSETQATGEVISFDKKGSPSFQPVAQARPISLLEMASKNILSSPHTLAILLASKQAADIDKKDIEKAAKRMSAFIATGSNHQETVATGKIVAALESRMILRALYYGHARIFQAPEFFDKSVGNVKFGPTTTFTKKGRLSEENRNLIRRYYNGNLFFKLYSLLLLKCQEDDIILRKYTVDVEFEQQGLSPDTGVIGKSIAVDLDGDGVIDTQKRLCIRAINRQNNRVVAKMHLRGAESLRHLSRMNLLENDHLNVLAKLLKKLSKETIGPLECFFYSLYREYHKKNLDFFSTPHANGENLCECYVEGVKIFETLLTEAEFSALKDYLKQ